MTTRYAFQGVLQDSSGDIVTGGTCKVYLAGGTDYATIYSAKTGGTSIDQSSSPITTDSNGRWKFFVSDSDYPVMTEFKLEFSKSGFTTTTYDDVR